MRKDLINAYFSLPTVREFVSSVVDILAEHRSVIVLLPASIETELVKKFISSELWDRSFWKTEISIDENHNEYPLDKLIDVFQPKWSLLDTPRTLVNFVEIAELPDIIELWDKGASEVENRKNWMKLIREWAKLSHQQINNGKKSTAICYITNADNLLEFIPENDIFLEVRWWWGVPSILEASLLCRQGSGFSSEPVDKWREKLLPSLAGSDLLLIDYLWDDISGTHDEIIGRLKDYQHEVSWTDDDSQQWQTYLNANGNHRTHNAGAPPPKIIQNMWARGLVYSTVEYGPEIHPTALVQTGKIDDIKHRIWRGQNELVLPLVDSLRLELCTRLNKRLGTEWPWKWQKPDTEEEYKAVKENPNSTQLGYLSWLIRKDVNFRKFQHWKVLVKDALEIRNNIAHSRTISLKDFVRLIQEIDELADN